jgi:hypothetical protein
MEEKLNAVILGLLPPGSEVVKVYKDAAGEIKVDVTIGGSPMTVSLKKNHAGSLYIE